MTGAVAYDDLRVLRQRVNHEIPVARHVVQTSLGVQLRTEEARDVLREPGLHSLYTFRVLVQRARIGGHRGTRGVNRRFGCNFAVDWETVDEIVVVPDEDRETTDREV